MNEKATNPWSIWLDNLQKIASFHSVADFELHEFLSPSDFERYAMALANSGYRFQ